MTDYDSGYEEIGRVLDAAPASISAALERVAGQLSCAHQLCELHPENAAEWREAILQAGHVVTEELRARGGSSAEVLSQAEQILSPLGETAKQYTLLCVSHAHIDMNWMWSWPETVAITGDTFHTMLQLLDEFPQFIYSQSQASVYRLIERYNPAMFEEIRAQVEAGRWEVTASQWVEGDKNMASGESLIRHLLYTREFMQDRFGLSPEDVTVAYEPDTFGHPATLPTILASGGVKYYYHCRGSRGPFLYWWTGADGARLLVHCGAPWYNRAIAANIVEPLVPYVRETGLTFMPVTYGVGDHGGGPTRRDLQRIAQMQTWPVFPQVRCAQLHDFFRQAEGVADGIPEISGERNFIFTGCYTSQARQKWANRHGENLLYTAEAAAVIGEGVAGVEYPGENLDEGWQHLLFSQFHDILPGSGVRETRHHAMGTAQETQASAAQARTNALRGLARRLDTESLRQTFSSSGERAGKDGSEGGLTGGAGAGRGAAVGGESDYSMGRSSDRAFLVFNPLPYPRREVVEATLWDTDLSRDNLVVSAPECETVPVQIIDEGTYWSHTFVTVAFPVEVPALGYRAVCVSDRRLELGLAPEADGDYWSGAGGEWRQIAPPDWRLENEQLRATVDPASGGLTELLDKSTGRDWVRDGETTGLFQRCLEENSGMTAWVIGRFMEQQDLLSGRRIEPLHRGRWLNAYRWTGAIGQSELELDLILRHGSPRLEFRLRVDWREMGSAAQIPHLKLRFPLDADAPRGRYEIPFGAIDRDLSAGEEVPAQRWVDITDSDGQGVVLANSCKYGFNLEGRSLNMTLLRASVDPDPLPDLGEHTIEYSLRPHGGTWANGDSMLEGESISQPLVVASCDFHAGGLPPAGSFVELDGEGVRLAALKKSQDGTGIIMRLVEVNGADARARIAIDPALLPKPCVARTVDAMERPAGVDAGAVRLVGNELEVRVPACGLASVFVGNP